VTIKAATKWSLSVMGGSVPKARRVNIRATPSNVHTARAQRTCTPRSAELTGSPSGGPNRDAHQD
jgi:hypothetical protein